MCGQGRFREIWFIPICDVARRVTKGARTPYEQAVKLQDWFRSDGGFTYSTAPAPGSRAGVPVEGNVMCP